MDFPDSEEAESSDSDMDYTAQEKASKEAALQRAAVNKEQATKKLLRGASGPSGQAGGASHDEASSDDTPLARKPASRRAPAAKKSKRN